MFLALIFISIAIGVIEGLPLACKKSWKAFITVILLLVIAVVLGIIKLLDYPTPLDIIANTLRPIGKAFFDYNK